MCVLIIGPLGVPAQPYASAAAVRSDRIGTWKSAPASTRTQCMTWAFREARLRGASAAFPHPAGASRGAHLPGAPAASPHPAGAPVYLNPAGKAAGRNVYR